MIIRPAHPGDCFAKNLFPDAAQFESNDFLLALSDEVPLAILAWRRVAPDEIEILHLETLGSFRNKGIARQLLRTLKQECCDLFLEVRVSNKVARHLYESEGFTQIGIRKNYYSHPCEEAIVLKFHSC